MFSEKQLQFEMVKHLNEDGQIINEKANELTPEFVLEMYQTMVKSRLLDEKLLRMQRQGRIGTYAPFSGQEASQIGSAYALEKTDWMIPSYREIAAALVHGLPMDVGMQYMKGHLHGSRIPDDVKMLPFQIIIAAQTLHGMGVALASKIRKENEVTVSYFGDGATSQGDFHEALNFASVYKLPVIFFCQNNQYAISVPIEQQMASKTIAQKAIAYGMEGVQVDGNDLFAVYQTMQDLVQRARNGEGPFLVEAKTYRMGPHTTSDDPTKYREKAEVEEWLQADPISRVRKWLVAENVWDEERDNAFIETEKQQLDEKIDSLENMSVPAVDEAFDYVYHTKHPLLAEQQAEAKALMNNEVGENNG